MDVRHQIAEHLKGVVDCPVYVATQPGQEAERALIRLAEMLGVPLNQTWQELADAIADKIRNGRAVLGRD